MTIYIYSYYAVCYTGDTQKHVMGEIALTEMAVGSTLYGIAQSEITFTNQCDRCEIKSLSFSRSEKS